MRNSFMFTLILLLILPVFLFAQEGEVKKEEKSSEFIPANILIINGGIHYKLGDLPYGSIGFGFEFPLGRNIAVGPGIRLVQTRVTSGSDYTGATSVEGGEINYIDIDFTLKHFLSRNLWISGSFIYEVFGNGYYVDNDGTNNLFVSLTNTEEPNNLAFQFSTGLYSSVKENVYVIPSFSVRYNLPIESGYSFSSSDINFSINLGIGFRM